MPLPLALERLDLSAPFDRYRTPVRPDWIDINGHMNVGYYAIAFHLATDAFCRHLGVNEDYIARGFGMIFAVETHITYLHELIEADPIAITCRVLDGDGKRMHLLNTMRHTEQDFVAATMEVMLVHVSTDARKPAPFPPFIRERIDQVTHAHKVLPWPEQAGRKVGIRRSA
jgi:acyl-CoA thioester hydrolase